MISSVAQEKLPQDEWLKREQLWTAARNEVEANIRDNRTLLAIALGVREELGEEQ